MYVYIYVHVYIYMCRILWEDFRSHEIEVRSLKVVAGVWKPAKVPSYEVELELKPKLLKKNLQAKVSGDSSHLVP